MANDRVFLRCDKCGDSDLFLLYTMMGAGLDLYWHEAAPYLDWLEKHAECHPNPYGQDLAGVPGFSVTTESTSDEIKFETVPCDHPEWTSINAGPLVSASIVEEVTRKECTVCGHKVTHIKRLVARELISPRRPTPS